MTRSQETLIRRSAISMQPHLKRRPLPRASSTSLVPVLGSLASRLTRPHKLRYPPRRHPQPARTARFPAWPLSPITANPPATTLATNAMNMTTATTTTTSPSSSSSPPGPKIRPPRPPPPITFSSWDVSSHVFLTTEHSYAMVNLKPLAPGHVLVCPLAVRRRLTDLTPGETTDLFAVVQVVQRMLARKYFPAAPEGGAPPEAGSFNIAIQDGPLAGQTVPHVHVHIIPRVPPQNPADFEAAAGASDQIYTRMASEEGNVGGALWDCARQQAADESRPVPGGLFNKIEDAARKARPMAEMESEAEEFRQELRAMGY